MLRQPRDEPAVLGRVSEARVNDDVMVARRQPRASNASLASLTVRSQYEPVGSSFMSQTDSIDGTSVHSAKMRIYGRPIYYGRPLYFCPVVSFFFFFFLIPRLSCHRLDVYHTSAHDVALV